MGTDYNENQGSDQMRKLIDFARTHLDFAEILNSYSRGGEYTLLFLKSEEDDADGIRSLWVNAWLASDEHVAEIEDSSAHLQGRYFREGFHPSYGTSTEGSYYEPIYGGPREPLALGWSADDKRIDPELSQEFERCYKLTRVEQNQKTIWNSWQEAIDDVAIREKGRNGTLTLIARTDFVRDFQFLRKRWLLIGVYGEWGKRTASEPHMYAVQHVAKEHKLDLFGVPEDSGYEYVEAQGYFLVPIPLQEQFSTGFGLGVPAGLKASAEKIEFQTSEGRLKPWDIREGKRRGAQFGAIAMFDQEVLRRYQSEPGAEVSLDNIGQSQISSRKVHLWRLAMLLGTEYVSVWVGYFVEGVPPAEWSHWQSFNIPFIGSTRHRELFGTKTLADWLELIDRAKALDGLIVERIAATKIRVFLKYAGFAPSDLEGLAAC